MRRFLSILVVSMLALTAVQSQPLNIATWVVELPDANPTNRAAEHQPFMVRAAAVLKPLNPDIIVLHGFPGRTATRQLAELLRPRVYHNPIYSSFRKDPPGAEQLEPAVTVLSKRQASHSKTVDWRSTGRLDIPGGFSFAVFPMGANVLALYTVQFPKVTAGMPRDVAAGIPRRRELCARFLVSHQNWLFEAATNGGKFAYLATDLEFDTAGATNDPALAILTQNGFKPCLGNRTLVASAALSSTGWPPDGSLTSAFLKGADFPGDPQSVEQKGFFAPVALIELDLKTPAKAPAGIAASGTTSAPTSPSSSGSGAGAGAANGSPAAASPLPPASGSAAVAHTNNQGAVPIPVFTSTRDMDGDALVSWADNRTLAVGAGVVLLGVLGILWAGRRRSPLVDPPVVPAGSLGTGSARPGSQRPTRLSTVETRRFGGTFQVLEHPMLGADPDEGFDSEPTMDEPPRSRASRGRGAPGASGGDVPPKGSNWTFLQLLRERLVRWLAAERSQLLSSHHAGAEQVLELEERLTRIQNQFESRLRAREQRVTELEAELMAKEKMMADLENALSGQLHRKPGSSSLPPNPPPNSPSSS